MEIYRIQFPSKFHLQGPEMAASVNFSPTFRYKPLQLLQQGAGRVVISAHDLVFSDRCVLKYSISGSSSAATLHEEGDRLSRLSHPHLVQWRGALLEQSGFEDNPVSGFVMDFVDGKPLGRDAVSRSLGSRLRAFGELLEVVTYLHDCGMLHLDLKPDNILQTDDGIVLLDLGTARPLSSDPGEAGGTMGYAAPEVLEGHAASVASDLYSLGAVLFELLTGQRPFQWVESGMLRQAVLSGVMVPARALRPDISVLLDELVGDLMQVDPAMRLNSLDELKQRLHEAGGVWERQRGYLPFHGRDDLVRRVSAHLQSSGMMAIVGDNDSGRSSLAQYALRLNRSPVRQMLDLSGTDDPISALYRLLIPNAPDHAVPMSVQGSLRAIANASERAAKIPWGIFFGRREDRSPALLRALDEISVSLVSRGAAVLWAARRMLPNMSTVKVGALGWDSIYALCSFYGVHTPIRVRELSAGTRQLPGILIRKLSDQESKIDSSHEELTQTLALLADLPAGIPERLVLDMPKRWQDDIDRLVSNRFARWGEDLRLYLERSTDGAPEPESQAQLIDLLQKSHEVDPLWLARSFIHLGEINLAKALFDNACHLGASRPSELFALCERLESVQFRPAHVRLAFLKENAGDLSGAAQLLARLDDRTCEEDLRFVRILRRLHQYDEALDLAKTRLNGALASFFSLEVSHIHMQENRFEVSWSSIDDAERLNPSLRDTACLRMRLRWLTLRKRARLPLVGRDALLARLDAQKMNPDLPKEALVEAAKLWKDENLEHADALFALAMERADVEEDHRTAVGIRINRFAILNVIGKHKEARKIGKEGTRIAREIGAQDLRLMLIFNIALFEYQLGRIPDGRVWVQRFMSESESLQSPVLQERRALLRALALFSERRFEEVIDFHELVRTEMFPTSPVVADSMDLKYAFALAHTKRVEEGLTHAHRLAAKTDDTRVQHTIALLRGVAHLRISQRHLEEAYELIPGVDEPTWRLEVGSTLLASAGLEMDPSSFPARREALAKAAKMLYGDDAARAATLRDQMTDGSSADLTSIVELTEAMQDPEGFPVALAKVITRAMGAHRVLLMLRIPGLGRQLSYNELSGAEAAGIGAEVLRRIKEPNDYWLADDAYSDPKLRETSQTVKTFELKSLVAVAIPYAGKAVGALYVDDQHRAGRFTADDVKLLRRLAKAIGNMLPSFQQSPRPARLVEPKDVFGVLMSDPQHVEVIENSVSLLQGHRQTNLLITGETGTGKSVLARRIARDVLKLSGLEVVVLRKGDPNMLVTQLTGSRRGEFTGAMDQEGAIQRAIRERRALFLDEVQNLGEEGQQILLPLLELPNRHFGGLTRASVPLDAPLHVILGTNVDVSSTEAILEHFREDLWYRMSATHIPLPPLRGRGTEAVYRYLKSMMQDGEEEILPEVAFQTSALYKVTTWRWPGNLRQLHAFAFRAVHRFKTTRQPIQTNELPRLGLVDELPHREALPITDGIENTVDRIKVERMIEALKRNQWVQKRAAAELKMKPANFSKLLKRFNLRKMVRDRRRELKDGLS
ncbi:MAG: sigma 54-interacting transcriptional regulator [Myxococcota bacterium]